MKKTISLILFMAFIFTAKAQNNVGIGTTSPSPRTILHLDNQGSSLGLLLPNVDFTTLTPLLSEEGMMIYDHTRNSIYFWNGTSWDAVVPGWSLSGNSGTNPASNYIGTSDAQDLVFRTNNNEILRITSAGNVGVGVNNPTGKFEVYGQNGDLSMRINDTDIQLGDIDGNQFGTTLTIDPESAGNFQFMNGDVGIGTTTPNEKLSVNEGNIYIGRSDGNDLFVEMNGDNNGVSWAMGVDDSQDADFVISNSNDLNNPMLYLGGGGGGFNGDMGLGIKNPGVEFYQPTNLSVNPKTFTISSNGNVFADNRAAVLELHGSSADNGDEIGAINFTNQHTNNIDYNFARISAHKENTNPTISSLRFYTRNFATMTEAMVINATGNVGIGTNSPVYKLSVNGPVNLNEGIASGTALRVNGAEALWYNGTYFSWGFGGSANFFSDNVGIGVTAPTKKLHIFDAVDPTIRLYSNLNEANGGTIQLFENNSEPGAGAYGAGLIYDGSANLFRMEMYDLNTINEAFVIERSTGDIGIGITTPSKNLHVVSPPSGTFDAAIYASSVAANNSGFFGALVYDQGPSNFGVYAHSDALPNTAALGVSRAADGGLVSFYSAGSLEGQISVSGNTITYGAFTGVHYAISEDETLERGMLVSLNGLNSNFHGKDDSEIIYGISKTSKANNSRVMGAYLGLMDPMVEKSKDNPSQIMAVGNGDMWVAENGQNLEVGDFLISSDLAGYAMLDKGEFDIAHVIARVGENVNWAEVSTEIDGRKVYRVSVFFEFFDRNHRASKLEEEVIELKYKTERIEAKLDKALQLLGTEVSIK